MYVKLLIFATLLAYTNGFCFNQPGGIGEYSKECMQSIGMFEKKNLNFFIYLDLRAPHTRDCK